MKQWKVTYTDCMGNRRVDYVHAWTAQSARDDMLTLATVRKIHTVTWEA